MNEIWSRITLTTLILALGISLVFLSDFLLGYLNKPAVVLVLVPIGVVVIGLVIRQAGSQAE